MAADEARRYREDTEKLIQSGRDIEVGTSAQIGARQRMRDYSSAAAYLSSLPKGDKFLKDTTGIASPYSDVSAVAKKELNAAQTSYANALKGIDKKPAATTYTEPEWAKSTIEMGMPIEVAVDDSSDKQPTPKPQPRDIQHWRPEPGQIRFCDKRLKENIVDLPSQWSNIKSLRPVEFDYIESEGGEHQIGFIAQDVEQIYPDSVVKREDGMLMLEDMTKQDARLVKALQEAMERIEVLEDAVSALKSV